MPWSQLCFPPFIRSYITPTHDVLQLVVRPCIKINRLDFANMHTHSTMYSGASSDLESVDHAHPLYVRPITLPYANKYASIPARPSGR